MDFCTPTVLQLLLSQADEQDQDHRVDCLESEVSELENHQIVELNLARHYVKQVDVFCDQHVPKDKRKDPVENEQYNKKFPLSCVALRRYLFAVHNKAIAVVNHDINGGHDTSCCVQETLLQ